MVYAFFAYLTFEIIAGTAGDQARKQRDLTAKVMPDTGRQILVGVIGTVARGVVFALAGVGVIDACTTIDPGDELVVPARPQIHRATRWPGTSLAGSDRRRQRIARRR